MNEQQFIANYERDVPIFTVWGALVNQEILSSLTTKLGTSVDVATFLRIPPSPRIKRIRSIVSKAFYRGKNYVNPYEDITDKVGLRYVVLLLDDIQIISNIVEHVALWSYSKDRDFEEENAKNPFTFDYQSVHYIVRNKSSVVSDGTTIPPGTPCEIQIRTLLQHACCELTHDTIYKPVTGRTNQIVYRSVAKSRALSEVNDDIFRQVNMTLQKEYGQLNDFLAGLITLYQRIQPSDYEEKANVFILDAMKELVESVKISDIDDYVFKTSSVAKIVVARSSASFLYKQPIVLLLFYLIQYHRERFIQLWPLTAADIQPLYSDLGIAFANGI